ncbi:hypothetical protein [Streptomyces cremeus]|uniref:Uncharacterized protein n=1 Tax=Streptomyces cremeus TaxID=66881 RepID=A0ABV5P9V9_STRCM
MARLSEVVLEQSPSYSAFTALMKHGLACCPECQAGALCPVGTRLMAAWEARRTWQVRTP